ncbi:MAG: transglycosylase SLT domain-containing protein, partial [Clostridia bacterium]|nr:transglycosylase SLT domain-containing protein [Clostridia bacterium]
MKQSVKRPLVILLIICLSIVIGLATDGIWTWIEKQTYPQDYSDLIQTYSEQYNVPSHLVSAVIKVESDFDPRAHSSAQAVGLMQMIPSTFAMLTGTKYLNEHLVDGETYLAICRELDSGSLSAAEVLIKKP